MTACAEHAFFLKTFTYYKSGSSYLTIQSEEITAKQTGTLLPVGYGGVKPFYFQMQFHT